MDCLIVNVPLLDPTLPPHSASYLIGAAKFSGFNDVEFFDLNIDAINSLFSPGRIRENLDYRDCLIEQVAKKNSINGIEAMRARICVSALPLDASSVESAYNLFRDAERFYNIASYHEAYGVVRSYFDLATAKFVPYQFNLFGNWTGRYGGIDTFDHLNDPAYISGLISPFESSILALEKLLVEKKPAVIGFSANYTTQLPYLVGLLKRVSAIGLSARIVCGGTEITDLFKHTVDKGNIGRIFENVDYLVVGEGEKALVDIISAVKEGRQPSNPNILQLDPIPKDVSPESVDINSFGIPDYACIEWSKYWSPEPVAMASPTRGCYWNKCTFCDYGLNFGLPTSPSRQLNMRNLLDTLSALNGYVNTMYLAVDAIAPSFLRKLSSIIVENGIELSWSAEIRLEKKLMSHDQLQQLRRGGCVALSFGYESGDHRILALIDKGVDIDGVPPLIEALRETDIKVQMMGFTGFPSETPEEAKRTYSFLEQHSESWLIAGIGPFVLTPGAIVAKQPEKFGITRTSSNGKDVQRSLAWQIADGTVEAGDRYRGLSDIKLNPFRMNRPFLGGIDTAHTILYCKKFLWTDLARMAKEEIHAKAWEVTAPIRNVTEWPGADNELIKTAAMSCTEILLELEARTYECDSSITKFYVVDGSEIYKSTGSDALDSVILEAARGVRDRKILAPHSELIVTD